MAFHYVRGLPFPIEVTFRRPLRDRGALSVLIAGVGFSHPLQHAGLSRRTCIPAEPYLPLRSLVVYSQGQVYATVGQKRNLTFAALSDMPDIRRV